MTDAEAFWTWSLATYPAVQELALRFQDNAGGDVNLLLFCAWIRHLAPEELDAVEAAVRPWRESVLVPLREARRGARGTPLYESLKSVELSAEKIAQKRICDALSSPSGQENALDLYLNRTGATDGLKMEIIEAFQRG
jgi:uncharacterized protein (TIGR02444 family)